MLGLPVESFALVVLFSVGKGGYYQKCYVRLGQKNVLMREEEEEGRKRG